jgi:hypothetical protein
MHVLPLQGGSMTSATNDTPATRTDSTAGAERGGLAAFMAVLTAMSRLVQDCKELPVPWSVGFTCYVRDRATLERLHELYGGKLYATWLDLKDAEALRPYLPDGVSPDALYVPMSVHIQREDTPL